MRALFKENKKTLALALPLIVGQVSQMLLGLTDTVMIGRVGTVDLAAAAFANTIAYFSFSVAIGLAVAVSVQVSHGHGETKCGQSAKSLSNGLFLAFLTGISLAILIAVSIPFLHLLKQPEDVTAIVPPYLYWIGASFIPMVPSLVIKSFAEAKNQPWVAFWIQLGGVFLNIFFNYILIFGNWGAPALGLTGAGIATFLARIITLWALWYYLIKSKRLAQDRPTTWIKKIDKSECFNLIRISCPVTTQLLTEIGSFAVGALLIGQFGSVPLAAHQIAVTCAATTFMLPLGLSMAVTIRVGHSIGSGQRKRCNRIIIEAHIVALIMMLACACSYILFGDAIARAFTPDLKVVTLVATLFPIVAMFQLFDGIQVISMAALRGIKDVNIPTAITFTSFWLFAIPGGALLAFKFGFQTSGIWIGLASGLSLAAIALTFRLIFQLKASALTIDNN